mmetsp:Transcript_94149/g.167461  ORF Transcript_94149/g.167461 Transcript_94149/m.167461 type:complete len:412 (-) Transcript_94149:32-1267(-)
MVLTMAHFVNLLILRVSLGNRPRYFESLQADAPASSQICDMKSPDFHRNACNMHSIGVANPKLLLNSPPSPTSVMQNGLRSPACTQVFHLLQLNETEQKAECQDLKECMISTWAAKMMTSLQQSDCNVDIDAARVIVLPGYTANECNWPIYGGGDCNKNENHARVGRDCRDSKLVEDCFKTLQRYYQKPVAILENKGGPGSTYESKLEADSFYVDPNFRWLMVGIEERTYRKDVDMSLPAGPPSRAAENAERLSKIGLEQRKLLAQFKGSLRSHATRAEAREAAAQFGPSIVIEDTEDGAHSFDDLLKGAVFHLILRGDAIFSSRWAEAVCSGGIPVLVTKEWVPPLNEVVPIDSYGLLHHSESDWRGLFQKMHDMPAETREKLRTAAINMCKTYAKTIEAQASAVASYLR